MGFNTANNNANTDTANNANTDTDAKQHREQYRRKTTPNA